MPSLQVRNISDALQERLRRHARIKNCTISAVVLTAVERELDRWEWQEHLSQRPKIDLGADAADLLAEERARRDQDTI